MSIVTVPGSADSAEGLPLVAVIIAAYEAAETLTETLESLIVQTFTDWEAIVVDDGSRDATADIARAYSERDRRICVLRQSHCGQAAALNTGLAAAGAPWLLFLDADDLIRPGMLERMTARARESPEAAAVVCRCRYLAGAGVELPAGDWSPRGDLFHELDFGPPFPVHAVLVRRSLIEEVGGWDARLRTSIDWDLWIRVARTGAKFVGVEEALALYRMRFRSISSNSRQMLEDGFEVLRRAHEPDPRVAKPRPEYREGFDRTRLPLRRLCHLCTCAGIDIGLDVDARPLLAAVAGETWPELPVEPVAWSLAHRSLLANPRGRPPGAAVWSELLPRFEEFLTALERRMGAPALRRRVLDRLARIVLERVPPPLTVGCRHSVNVELGKSLDDLEIPVSADRAHLHVRWAGKLLGKVELPAVAGRVTHYVWSDGVADNLTWLLLDGLLAEDVYPEVEIKRVEGSEEIWRQGVCILRLPSPRSTDGFDEPVRWTLFLQELWGRPRWQHQLFYDPSLREEETPERLLAGEPIELELSQELPSLITAAPTARVIPTVGGVPVGMVEVGASEGRIDAQVLRVVITQRGGFELCRAAVRAALVEMPWDVGGNLRERLARAEAARRGSSPEDVASARRARLILGRRLSGAMGTAVSRRAELPPGAVSELRRAAASAGELARVDRTGKSAFYAPELIDLRAAEIERPSAPESRSRQEESTHAGLPILAYHSVAPTESGPPQPYRISPAVFEQQLRYLRNQGYYSVRLEEWLEAQQFYTPLPGRPILLTFDDGYTDFARHAWPLLERYGFGAMVFLVAGWVGGRSSWNVFDPSGRLLSWRRIRRLQRDGVEFGAHSFSHPCLTTLSVEEIVGEAIKSRRILQDELGCAVRSFAYPFGDHDPVVTHLVGGCGFIFGLTCRPARSELWNAPLELPRLLILAEDTLDRFAIKLQGGAGGRH